MSLSRFALKGALLCAVGVSGWVFAASPPAVVAGSQPENQTDKSASHMDGFDQPVTANTLQRYSGGAMTTNNNQALHGTVSNDSASQVVTGNNAITGDAFSNASGLPSVIQNTGNNVLIQNGVIVNVEMKQ